MLLKAMVNCFNMPKEFINETKRILYVSPKFIWNASNVIYSLRLLNDVYLNIPTKTTTLEK